MRRLTSALALTAVLSGCATHQAPAVIPVDIINGSEIDQQQPLPLHLINPNWPALDSMCAIVDDQLFCTTVEAVQAWFAQLRKI